MWRIHVVLLAAVVLGAPLSIWAQGEQPALVGLPEYGVTLSGSPENPVIDNHSGKTIIGYDVESANANGEAWIIHQITADSRLPAGVPDGASVYPAGAVPVNPIVPLPSAGRPADQRAIVRTALRSVIFADGQFAAAADERGAFEQFAKQLKAITEVGILAKTGAWDQVEALAQVATGGAP